MLEMMLRSAYLTGPSRTELDQLEAILGVAVTNTVGLAGHY